MNRILAQGVSMEKIHRITWIRWTVMLPILMSALSVFLMLLAKRQQLMLFKMGTGWEVPARLVNGLINGPGFFLGRLIPIPIPDAVNRSLNYDADRLSGILVFWFLIGLTIDRRRNKRALDLKRPMQAGILFTFAALVCGVFGFAAIAHVFVPVRICPAGTKAQE
jgi:hypothetical protein